MKFPWDDGYEECVGYARFKKWKAWAQQDPNVTALLAGHVGDVMTIYGLCERVAEECGVKEAS